MAKTYQQVILFTIILCVCRFQIRTKRIIWNCKRVQAKSNQKRILRNLHFCKGLQTFFLSSLECCCTCFQTQTLSSLPVVTLHVRKLGAWNSGVWVLHVGYSWTHSIKSCIHMDRSGLMHTAACIQLRAYSCAHTAARIQLHAYSCAHTAARIQLHAYSCAHTAESIRLDLHTDSTVFGYQPILASSSDVGSTCYYQFTPLSVVVTILCSRKFFPV